MRGEGGEKIPLNVYTLNLLLIIAIEFPMIADHRTLEG